MSSVLRTWSLVLLVALRGVAVLVLGVMGFAAVVIVADLADRTDDWDGFGVFLGLIALALGAVHLVMLVGLARVVRAGRTQERRALVGWAAVGGLVLGGLWVAWGFGLAVDGSQLSTVLWTLLPGLALTAPSLQALIAVAIDRRQASTWAHQDGTSGA